MSGFNNQRFLEFVHEQLYGVEMDLLKDLVLFGRFYVSLAWCSFFIIHWFCCPFYFHYSSSDAPLLYWNLSFNFPGEQQPLFIKLRLKNKLSVYCFSCLTATSFFFLFSGFGWAFKSPGRLEKDNTSQERRRYIFEYKQVIRVGLIYSNKRQDMRAYQDACRGSFMWKINGKSTSCWWTHMNWQNFVFGPPHPKTDFHYPENDLFVTNTHINYNFLIYWILSGRSSRWNKII